MKIMNFKKFFENYFYQGNCINSFDSDGDCLLSIFRDTSDFACVEENSQPIDQNEFNLMTNNYKLSKGNYLFLYNKDRDILMAYDKNKDVHYFFAK